MVSLKYPMMSVKGVINTFYLSSKWTRNLQFLICFSRDIHRDPHQQKQFKYQNCILKNKSGGGSLQISHEKYIKEEQSSFQLGV
jgi:hypothetical protein